MSPHWKHLAGFVPSHMKSRSRLYLLVLVFCVAATIILEMEKGATVSTHILSVAAAIVIALGCLIYTPPRLLLWLAIGAVGTLIVYGAKGLKDWQILAGLIVICSLCVTWCIDKASNLILRRLDTIEEKLEEIELKQDGSQ